MAALLNPELAAYIPRFIQIESGGDPNAKTGSYTGLLQMGPDEIRKYGGNGLEQGTALLADRAAELEKALGRPVTPTELYLAHQQGMGGVQAHMANPDRPAWENMAATAEGQKKGAGWAKKAIWGNVPDNLKAQFPGGVDSLTSQQFMDLWRSKVERTPMAPPLPAPTEVASLPQPAAPISGPTPLQPQKPLPPQPLNLGALPVPAQPFSAPAPFQPQQPLPPQPLNLAQPQLPPLNAPLRRAQILAQAFSKIPLPPGFRGYSVG